MTKLLADWLPILLFFVAYKMADLYVATAVAIAASIVLMGWMRLRSMPIDKMQWVSLGLIVVFGGATLLLQDERFIKLKPSLLYGLFGLGLLIPQLFRGTRLIEKLLAGKVELPVHAWARLNAAWGVFFVGMAALNLWVAATFQPTPGLISNSLERSGSCWSSSWPRAGTSAAFLKETPHEPQRRDRGMPATGPIAERPRSLG